MIVLPTSAVSPPHIGANEKARSAELLARGETASGSTPTGLRRTRIVGPRIASSPFVRQDLIWAESGGGGGSSSLHKHLLLHRNPHLGHQGSAPPSGLSRVTSERAINHHRINPRETVSIVASTNNNAGGSTTVSTVTTTVSRSLFTNGDSSDGSGDGQSGRDGEHTVVTTVLTQQRRHSVSVTWDQQSLLEAQAQKVRTQQALRGKGDQWEEGDEGEDDDGWEEMRLHEKQPIRRKEKSDVNKEKEDERIEVIIPDVKAAEEDEETVKKEEQEKEKEKEREKEKEKLEKEKEKEKEEEKEERGSGKEDAGKEIEAGKEKSWRRKRKTSSKGHGDSLRDSKGKEKTKLKEKEKEKEREKNMEKSKITDEEKEESRPLSHSKTDAASRRKDLAGTDTSDRSVKVYRFLRIYLFFLVLC